MGKRARSEDDENCGGQGLLKTHVSEREVNLGVLQERRMQDVYNKTMEMLFRGTKNLANNNAVPEVEKGEAGGEAGAVRSRRDRQSYRQLALSSDCSLVADERPGPRLECVSCARPHCDLSGLTVCGVCRGRVGSLCVLQCGQCWGPTCGLCSQISPSGRTLCRNCYC